VNRTAAMTRKSPVRTGALHFATVGAAPGEGVDIAPDRQNQSAGL
jgi:hypothetical protein